MTMSELAQESTKIAVYDSYTQALNAIEKLVQSGFSKNQISILSKMDEKDDGLHVKDNGAKVHAGALVGGGAGVLAGLLSGIGVFSIPGFGFLYGAGALIGALGGIDLGVFSGGAVALLTELGVSEKQAHAHKHHLESGNFVLVLQGSEAQVSKATQVLQAAGNHVALSEG